MSGPAQGVNPEVRAKFMQMREDIKKVSNTLQDIEAQQSEYRYGLADQIEHRAIAKPQTDHRMASHHMCLPHAFYCVVSPHLPAHLSLGFACHVNLE